MKMLPFVSVFDRPNVPHCSQMSFAIALPLTFPCHETGCYLSPFADIVRILR